jgi:hypothetical protein
MKTAILIYSITAIILYFIISFLALNFNIYNWSLEIRVSFIMLILFFGGLFNIFYNNND